MRLSAKFGGWFWGEKRKIGGKRRGGILAKVSGKRGSVVCPGLRNDIVGRFGGHFERYMAC